VFGMNDWLTGLHPGWIYGVVALVIMAESMGVPLPGEITLVSAALLAVNGGPNIWGIAAAATAGAIIGDSIGYFIGHRGGRPLLNRLSRRFPRHFGPPQLARAEGILARYGVWAVFFGRFVALLRILCGPLAGALRMPYRKFLGANAAGGLCWAAGTALAVYYLGSAVKGYLQDFSWIALVIAIAFGVTTTLVLRRRAHRAMVAAHAQPGQPAEPVATEKSGVDR
jgi:membrane protein DedA with SNARE-associated domain